MTFQEHFYQLWNRIQDNYDWAIFNMSLDVVKVNPETNSIDDDESKNTRIDYWIEGGPYEIIDVDGVKTPVATHDMNLDTGGESFESAFVKYAELVEKYYKPEN